MAIHVDEMAFLVHSERMNTTQVSDKIKNLRLFKSNLFAAVAALGATAKYRPKDSPGSWRITAGDNENVYVDLIYTDYDYHGYPTLYFTSNSRVMVSNLTSANLKKHLIKHLAKRRADLSAQALDDAKDDAGSKAEEAMAKSITAFLPKSMKHIDPAHDDNEISHIWRSERGQFRLAYIHVTGTVNSFEFEYNVEYKFAAGLTRDIKLEGEFEVTNTRDMETMLSGILQLGQ